MRKPNQHQHIYILTHSSTIMCRSNFCMKIIKKWKIVQQWTARIVKQNLFHKNHKCTIIKKWFDRVQVVLWFHYKFNWQVRTFDFRFNYFYLLFKAQIFAIFPRFLLNSANGLFCTLPAVLIMNTFLDRPRR